jgi:uncharacterized membrane protein
VPRSFRNRPNFCGSCLAAVAGTGWVIPFVFALLAALAGRAEAWPLHFGFFASAVAPASHAQAPATKPSQTPTSKPSVGPAAPQSTHYPVLLLIVGNDGSWNLRLGPKGPERLDRTNYPPIPLEPAEVTREGAAEAWTYRAHDLSTGAAVAVHLSREACSDATTTKYSFKAVVEHAQLGSLNGCARIAAELFPRVNPEEEDEDAAAKKPPETTITNFKMPVDIAYLSPTRKVMYRHLRVPKMVAAEGSQLALSHDGKRLLYTREDKATDMRAIVLYDSATGKSTDVLTGAVQQAFWSPDDTRIAFLKFVDGKWQLWIAPVATPEMAAVVYPQNGFLQGWVDAHTLLFDDLQQLTWVGDDGTVRSSIPEKDIFGDAFSNSSANTFRVHPLNPDLLLVSAEWIKPPQGVPVDSHMGGSFGFFLYEIRARRHVQLSPLTMFAQGGEWSRDGLQVFFTGMDAAKHIAVWHIFWDASGLKRYLDGTSLVIGQ